ncbi:MAG: CinA family protein [Prevotella sp.]|nr:CinA family protein [Prevotella sp.]
MELETKVLGRQIQEALYKNNETLCTAESCTGGKISQAIIAVPGASQYFKGSIVAYSNEVKENLLHVSHQVLEEQSAVCEEVARQMVVGACQVMQCDYAISTTGIAGPTGGTVEIPVGTIWIGYGSKDDVRTLKLSDDFGRDINLEIATSKAMQLFIEYYKEKHPVTQEE